MIRLRLEGRSLKLRSLWSQWPADTL